MQKLKLPSTWDSNDQGGPEVNEANKNGRVAPPIRQLRSAEFALLTTLTKGARMIAEKASGSPSEGNIEAVGKIMEMLRAAVVQYQSSVSSEDKPSSLFDAMEIFMDKVRLASAKELDLANMMLTIDALVEERNALKAAIAVKPQEIANSLRADPGTILDCLNITSQYDLRAALALAIRRKRRQNSEKGCGNG
ncbi:MAG: hypothetical protein HZA95_01240 [Candidatus Vogelbacteria bacterium]|nr:hypothetical protein [Candidatus Vogelbacteria bacterium]